MVRKTCFCLWCSYDIPNTLVDTGEMCSAYNGYIYLSILAAHVYNNNSTLLPWLWFGEFRRYSSCLHCCCASLVIDSVVWPFPSVQFWCVSSSGVRWEDFFNASCRIVSFFTVRTCSCLHGCFYVRAKAKAVAFLLFKQNGTFRSLSWCVADCTSSWDLCNRKSLRP